MTIYNTCRDCNYYATGGLKNSCLASIEGHEIYKMQKGLIGNCEDFRKMTIYKNDDALNFEIIEDDMYWLQKLKGRAKLIATGVITRDCEDEFTSDDWYAINYLINEWDYALV